MLTAGAIALVLALCSAALGAAAPAPPVTAIAAGADHTCALLAGGSVECWGANGAGQLGDGTTRGPQRCQGSPCATAPVGVPGLSGAVAIAAGGARTCAVLGGRTVDCWGAGAGSAPVAVKGVSGAASVSVGEDHACALLGSGGVECWGAGGDGQLGGGSSGGPVAVAGVRDAVAVAAGAQHSCALISGGSVRCWGANGYGQLGTGTSSGPQSCGGEACSRVSVAVAGVGGAVAIAAGDDYTCALLAGGTVDCWGYNFAGELGIGTSSGPSVCSGGGWCSAHAVAVEGLGGASAISAGGDHTCAITAGALDCWGYNSYGQLGDGQSGGPQTCYWQLVRCAKTPVAAGSLSHVVAVAAGGDHTCALLAAGTVRCWGADWFGDLGDGARAPQDCNGYPCSTRPVAVDQTGGTSRYTRTGGFGSKEKTR
jgi:alpha-tubulin suppressor-like RCC1 family protein